MSFVHDIWGPFEALIVLNRWRFHFCTINRVLPLLKQNEKLYFAGADNITIVTIQYLKSISSQNPLTFHILILNAPNSVTL